MRKIKWGVLIVSAFSVALALPGNVAHVQPLHDHFKAYNVTGPPLPVPIDVLLVDQFVEDPPGVQGVVERLSMFSPPVEKILPGGEVSPIVNFEDHLMWYNLVGPVDEPQRTLLVTNQFGTDQEWVVKNPILLLLPSWKVQVNGAPTGHPAPADVDHYLCYEVISGPPVGLDGVTLTDQFHQEFVTVGDPMVFCNPVDKVLPDDGVGIYDNENHLACYDISPHLLPIPLEVWALDQFDGSIFNVLENQYLCVPSTKKIKPSGCFASIAEAVE